MLLLFPSLLYISKCKWKFFCFLNRYASTSTATPNSTFSTTDVAIATASTSAKLQTSLAQHTTSNGDASTININYIDTPGAGSYYYSMRAKFDNSGGTTTIAQVYLYAIQVSP